MKSFESNFEHHLFNARIFSDLLIPQINLWKTWTEQTTTIFESFEKHWLEFQDYYKIAEGEAVQVLRKYKWFITPSLPLSLLWLFQIVVSSVWQ